MKLSNNTAKSKVAVFLVVLILFLGLIPLVFAAPAIGFMSPTPPNATTTSNTSVLFNVSINESNLGEFKWIWNNTNYTMYNDSLVLMLNFDNNSRLGEGSSNLTVDASRYENNGYCSGMGTNVCNWTTGKYGKGMSFDGTNDYIDVINESLFDLNSFTFSAWVMIYSAPPTTNWKAIITKGDDGPFTIGTMSSSSCGSGGEFGTGLNDGSFKNACSGIVPSINQWYYITITDTGSNRTIYVNGIYTGSINHNAAHQNNYDVYIGENGEARGRYWNGLIDEVNIWNISLNATEVLQSYLSNLQKYNISNWIFTANETTLEQLGDYTYNYSACAKDNVGNSNCTETRELTISAIAPGIGFMSPTPANGTTTSNTSMLFNVSINESNLGEFKWIWNNTNYTMYNNSLMLMLNFDNNSRLGEGSSNLTVDASRNGNNGYCSGMGTNVCNWTTGKYGGGMNFDGTNDYITLLDYNNLNFGTQNFTISLWFNNNGTTVNYPTLITTYGGWSSGSFGIRHDNVGSGHAGKVTVHWNPVGDPFLVSTNTFADNTWNYVTLTRNGTAFSLYVNNKLEASGTSATAIDLTYGGQTYLGWGQWDGANGYWKGLIDEVRIWNRSIDWTEINQTYTSNLQKYNISNWIFTANETNLPIGTYNYSASAKDIAGNLNTTETRLITIVNTHPPTHSTPILNSTLGRNTTTENLTVYNISTQDIIGDPVKNIINWYRNNTPLMVLNMPFEGKINTTNASDYSGYQYNGTINGATWTPTGGYDGKGAFTFDGVNDYISAPLVTTKTANVTISAWFKTVDYRTAGQFIVYIGSDNEANGYGFSINSEDTTDGSLKMLYGGIAWFDTGIDITNSNWHHGVMVINSTRNAQFYLDGVNIYNSTESVPTTPTTYTEIGRNDFAVGHPGVARYFNGTIDEVKVYNVSLTPSQISALYNNRTDLIDSSMLAVGDSWNASITPNDGTSDGTTLFTTSLTIRTNPDISPISFVSPTPANGTIQKATNVQINVSITGSTLTSLIYNWNGSNFTMYDNSLKLMMNFDNVSNLGENNSKVVDVSRYSNNGTVNGSVWISSGKYRGAYNFDGVDDYINSSALSFTTSNITITAWIKGRPTGAYTGIIYSRDPIQAWGIHYRSTSGQLAYTWNNNSESTYNWISGLSPTPDTWTFVALSINSSQACMYMSNSTGFYSANNTIAHSVQALNTVINIGYDTYSNDRHFNGTIDEVRIWNRSLSSTEIYEQYVSNLQKYNSSQWYLSVNQSLNTTNVLTTGNYTYQAFVTNSTGNTNATPFNFIIIKATPPLWYNNKTNLTRTTPLGQTAYFNITANDTNPGQYIFSFYNGTDWANDSSQNYVSGREIEVNKTITGSPISWTWYINDSLGNLNQTTIWTTNLDSTIGLSLVYPTTNINVTSYRMFNVTVNVSCTGQFNCGEINVSLDPATTIVYNFTTCNQTGNSGPTQTNCSRVYNGTTLNNLVNVTDGYQRWIVPTTGTYTIEANGAGGGLVSCSGYYRGFGARVSGNFSLTQGEVLFIVVGQRGSDKICSDWGAGGGGFSTVAKNVTSSSYQMAVVFPGAYVTPLVVAAGAGGTGDNSGSPGNPNATNFTAGTGSGGLSEGDSGGGAGFLGNGTEGSCGSTGAKSFLNGSNGSTCSYFGGFGGGGSPFNSGGGGGGYTGGNGTAYVNAGRPGTSYNSAVNPINTAAANNGTGYITITYISQPKSGLVSTNTSAVPYYTNTSNPYQVNLTAGQSQIVTWWVNATGSVNTTHTFFAYANRTANPTNANQTNVWNVSITAIDIDKPFTWNSKTNLSTRTLFGETVFFNITANDTNPAQYIFSWYNGTDWVNDTPQNYTSGQEIEVNKTITGTPISWTWYFNDTFENRNQSTTWTTGLNSVIGLSLVYPTTNIDITQYYLFNVTVNVSCAGQFNCGEINVSLDPASSTIYNFTTCNQTGREGPTQAQCNANYTGTTLAGINVTGGIQYWTVPQTGTYTIQAVGAGGGNGTVTYRGGKGARMVGTFTLTAGQVIKVLVGQKGGDLVSYNGGGGGGGSFVTFSNNTPLIIAGGGGGGGGNSNAAVGQNGLNGTMGGNGSQGVYTGGINGLGGGASAGSSGAGGLTGNGTQSSCTCTKGIAFIYNGSGGSGGTCAAGGGAGGFGGGSGGEWCCQGATGPGGGYSGGAGTDGNGVAGGGASYNSGTNQTNVTGNNSEQGYVTITFVTPAKSGLVTTNTSATPFYTNTSNPYNISLNTGESQVITFWVNATGSVNTTHTFFVYANKTTDMSVSNQTANWNVTIIPLDTNTPIISNNKTNISTTTPLGETVYFNITVNDSNSNEYIFSFYNGTDWVNDTAKNYISGREIEVNKTINSNPIIWIWYFNDTFGNRNQYVGSVALDTYVGIELVSPITDINITSKKLFNVTVNVSCFGLYNCQDINVTVETENAAVFDNFDTGALSGDYWTTYSSAAGFGRAIVSDTAPYSGTYAVLTDVLDGGGANLNELITNFDFTGSNNIIVSYMWKEAPDQDEQNTGANHNNHHNSDAVYYTCNGTYWYLLTSAPSNFTSWANQTINVSAHANFCTNNVTSSFKIKFTQYDDTQWPNDGIAWDDIRIQYGRQSAGVIRYNSSATPFYTNTSNPATITLDRGQSQIVTFWINASGSGNETFKLFVNANRTISMNNSNQTAKINVTIRIPDNTTPLWTNNKTNLTRTTPLGETVYFNITFTEEFPDKYIFSWYNGTYWINDSPENYTNGQQIQVIKTIDTSPIYWTWYFNDTSGNVNQTTVWSVELNSAFSISRIYPTTNINATQDQFFNVTVLVNCTSATPCREINVSLDPAGNLVTNGDFETGTMTGWTTGGNGNWAVQSTTKKEGTYAAKSGSIGHSQYTYIVQNITTTTASNITFSWYVSSESGYDYLGFCINQAYGTGICSRGSGNISAISGTGAGWVNVNTPLLIGNNQLLWYYAKDGSVVVGDDAGYIDNVSIVGTLSNKGGLITTNTSATPFWVNATNPINISLVGGQTQEVTFWVNATGTGNTTYQFFVFGNKTSNPSINNITSTWNVTIQDLTIPGIQYASSTLVNGTYSQNWISVNVTATDTRLSSIVINYYNGTRNLVNSTLNTTSPNYKNLTPLADGTYYFNASASDTASNSNYTETRMITLDTTPPQTSYASPTPANNTQQILSFVQINTSIVESVLTKVAYEWNGTSYWMYNNSLSLLLNFDNVSSIGENNSYVVDVSNRSYTGIINGPIVNRSAGKYSGALVFDGINDYVNITRLTSVNQTVGLWLKQSGVWTHYINASGTFYQNGALVDGQIEIPINNNSGTVLIGQYTNETYFNGTIDDVRIWDTNITAAEAYVWYISNLNKNSTTQWYFYANQSTNTTTGLSELNYTYNVYAYDNLSNVNNSGVRKIVIDYTPPTFINATNMTFEHYAGVNYTLNATDVNALWCYRVNDTTRFNVNCTGYIRNNTALPVSVYGLNLSINDTAGNVNWTLVWINVTDTTPPALWNITNFTQEYVTALGRNINATDSNPLSCFKVNDSNFKINCTGYLENNTRLRLGMHYLNITVNDTYRNENYAIFWINVTDTTGPTVTFDALTSVNNTKTPNTWFIVNTSIIEEDLNETIYQFNGTNYTIYNRSLVAMFNFDNITSIGENDSLVVDVSTYQNNGTVVGPQFNKTGIHNGAYQFDGIDDYVQFPTSFESNDLTLSAWVYKQDLSTINGIFGNKGATGCDADSSRYGFSLFVNSWATDNGKLILEYGNSSGGCNNLMSDTNAIPDDTWKFITIRFNSATSNLSMYIDGNYVNSTTYARPFSVQTASRLGVYSTAGTGYPFKGLIDEVKIWNRSLSDAEIYEQYVTHFNKYDIDKWALYTNQSKNTTAGLSDGSYTYLVYAKDIRTNANQTTLRTIVVDTVAPAFTSITNQTIYEDDAFAYNIGANDANGISCFRVNDTSRFRVNCTGYMQNNATPVVGTYWVNVTINDTASRETSELISITVVDKGRISVDVITPTTHINASQNDVFIVTVNVSCRDNNCGLINVTLDPTSQPVSCKQILDTGLSTGSGNYSIYPYGNSTPLQVYCDMTTEGGGWTLFANMNSGACVEGVTMGANPLTSLSTIYATNKLGVFNHSQWLVTHYVGGVYTHLFVMTFNNSRNLSNRFGTLVATGERVAWYGKNTTNQTIIGNITTFRFSSDSGISEAGWYSRTTISSDDGCWGVANVSTLDSGAAGPGLGSVANPRFGFANDNSGDSACDTYYMGYTSGTSTNWIGHVYLRENATYVAAPKGTVSTNSSATPYWTSSPNPTNVTLNQNEYALVTWNVNATGTVGTNNEFFAYANRTNDLAVYNSSARWNVTIIANAGDITAPVFTTIANQTFEYRYPWNYTIRANDSSGVSCYRVNDTTNFRINCTGFLTNNTVIATGVYWLNVSVNDTYNNTRREIIWVNVTPTTLPTFTSITNKTVAYNSMIVANVTATDGSGINCYNVNESTYFKINCTGYLENKTLVPVGFYYLNITANDTIGNENSEIMTVNVTQNDFIAPSVNITYPLNGSTFNYTITNLTLNVTTNENATCFYETNLAPTNYTMSANATRTGFNASITTIGANYTAYVYCRDDSLNWNSTESVSFAVNMSPTIALYLISPTTNINISKHTMFNVTVNVTCLNEDCNQINVSLDPISNTITNGNFETGTMTDWTFTGNNNWSAQTTTKLEGSYAAKSGAINHNQNAVMIQNITLTSATNITFYWKVSSESGYDYIGFCVDKNFGQTGCTRGAGNVTAISGSVDWTKKTTTLAAGNHQLLWYYAKDGSVVYGSDAGYVDNITIQGIATKSGLVSTNSSATPFYTNTSNPYVITLNKTQSQLITFWVNATGNLNETYEFYVYANKTSYPIANQTIKWNVTILDAVAPGIIYNAQTATNGTHSLEKYIVVNVSAADSSLDKVMIYLYNTTGLMYSNATSFINYTNLQYGVYYINATANDTSGNRNATDTRIINLTYPTILVTRVYPTTDLNVTQDRWFNVTLNVTCLNQDCGNVNVTLDPASTIECGDITNCDFSQSGDCSSSDGTCTSIPGWTYTLITNGTNKRAKVSTTSNPFGSGNWLEFRSTYAGSGTTNWQSYIYSDPFLASGSYITYNFEGEDYDEWGYGLMLYEDGNESQNYQLLEYRCPYTGSWSPTSDVWGGCNDNTNYLPAIAINKTVAISASLLNKNIRIKVWTGDGGTGDYGKANLDNICLSYSNGLCISSRKAIIPTIVGATPFWTNKSSNPYTVNLNRTNSSIITYFVNATGTKGNTYEFYAYASPAADTNIVANSTHWNVTIIDLTIPEITFLTNTTTAGNHSQTYISANVSAYDDNLLNVTIFLYNKGGLVNTTLLVSEAEFNELSLSDSLPSSPMFVISETEADSFILFNNLPNDDYYLNATAYDSSNNSASTETRQITLDTIAPLITILSPVNTTNTTRSQVNVTFTVNDNLTTNCTAYFDQSGAIQYLAANNNASISSGVNTTLLVSNLTNRTYLWYIGCNDGAGNINVSETRTLTSDNQPPSISISSPIDNSSVGYVVYLNSEVSEALTQLETVWYHLYNNSNASQSIKNGTLNSTESWDTVWNTSQYVEVEWNITYSVFANDTLGNTINVNRSFHLDNVNPVIQMITPSVSGYYNANYSMNIVVQDSSLNYTFYNITRGTTVVERGSRAYSPIVGQHIWNNTVNVSGYTDGQYSLGVMAQDSTGRITRESRTFYIDKVAPSLTVVSPTDGSYLNAVTLNFNWTSQDNVSTTLACNLSVGTVVKDTVCANATYCNYTVNSFTDAQYNYSIGCRDNATNTINETNTFTIDTTVPGIRFNKGTTETGNYSQNYIIANISITEANIDTIIVRLYNATNQTINTTQTTSRQIYLNYTNLPEGRYYLNATINDSVGYSNFTNTSNIFLDYVKPQATIGINDTTLEYGSESVKINWSVTENSVKTIIFNITLPNGALISESNSSTGSIILTPNDLVGLGTYRTRLYVEDIAGNSNLTTRTFGVDDTITPSLTLRDPITGIKSQDWIFVNATGSDISIVAISLNLFNTIGLYMDNNGTSYNHSYNFTGLPEGTYYYNATGCDETSCNSTETQNIILHTTAPNLTLVSPTLTSGEYNDSFIVINVSAVESYLTSITVYLYNGTEDLINTSTQASSPFFYNFTGLNDGTYYINASAIDSAGNRGAAKTESYTLTPSALDGDMDGVPDVTDTLLFNETFVNETGVSRLNITIDGNCTYGTYADLRNIKMYDASSLMLNFSHNFSESTLDLRKVTIIKDTNSIIVNITGQLQSEYNKTIYITDNSFYALCVKDEEVSSINAMTASCTGNNETDFTTCLGNSVGVTQNGITCIDHGDTIEVQNLQHSAVRGTPTTTPVEETTTTTKKAGGGGGGGGVPSNKTKTNETTVTKTPEQITEEEEKEKIIEEQKQEELIEQQKREEETRATQSEYLPSIEALHGKNIIPIISIILICILFATVLGSMVYGYRKKLYAHDNIVYLEETIRNSMYEIQRRIRSLFKRKTVTITPEEHEEANKEINNEKIKETKEEYKTENKVSEYKERFKQITQVTAEFISKQKATSIELINKIKNNSTVIYVINALHKVYYKSKETIKEIRVTIREANNKIIQKITIVQEKFKVFYAEYTEKIMTNTVVIKLIEYYKKLKALVHPHYLKVKEIILRAWSIAVDLLKPFMVRMYNNSQLAVHKIKEMYIQFADQIKIGFNKGIETTKNAVTPVKEKIQEDYAKITENVHKIKVEYKEEKKEIKENVSEFVSKEKEQYESFWSKTISSISDAYESALSTSIQTLLKIKKGYYKFWRLIYKKSLRVFLRTYKTIIKNVHKIISKTVRVYKTQTRTITRTYALMYKKVHKAYIFVYKNIRTTAQKYEQKVARIIEPIIQPYQTKAQEIFNSAKKELEHMRDAVYAYVEKQKHRYYTLTAHITKYVKHKVTKAQEAFYKKYHAVVDPIIKWISKEYHKIKEVFHTIVLNTKASYRKTKQHTATYVYKQKAYAHHLWIILRHKAEYVYTKIREKYHEIVQPIKRIYREYTVKIQEIMHAVKLFYKHKQKDAIVLTRKLKHYVHKYWKLLKKYTHTIIHYTHKYWKKLKQYIAIYYHKTLRKYHVLTNPIKEAIKVKAEMLQETLSAWYHRYYRKTAKIAHETKVEYKHEKEEVIQYVHKEEHYLIRHWKQFKEYAAFYYQKAVRKYHALMHAIIHKITHVIIHPIKEAIKVKAEMLQENLSAWYHKYCMKFNKYRARYMIYYKRQIKYYIRYIQYFKKNYTKASRALVRVWQNVVKVSLRIKNSIFAKIIFATKQATKWIQELSKTVKEKWKEILKSSTEKYHQSIKKIKEIYTTKILLRFKKIEKNLETTKGHVIVEAKKEEEASREKVQEIEHKVQEEYKLITKTLTAWNKHFKKNLEAIYNKIKEYYKKCSTLLIVKVKSIKERYNERTHLIQKTMHEFISKSRIYAKNATKKIRELVNTLTEITKKTYEQIKEIYDKTIKLFSRKIKEIVERIKEIKIVEKYKQFKLKITIKPWNIVSTIFKVKETITRKGKEFYAKTKTALQTLWVNLKNKTMKKRSTDEKESEERKL